MKRSFIILIVILSIINIVFSQNIVYEDDTVESLDSESTVELPKKYQYNIELHYLGVGATIERRIDNKISIGLGTSLGEVEYILLKPSFYPNVMYPYFIALHLFTSYYKSQKLKFEFGAKLSAAQYTSHRNCNGPCYGGYSGAYLAVLYGRKHFKIGSRVSLSILTITSENDFYPVVILKPLFLRISF